MPPIVTVTTSRIATGFSRPVFVTAPPGDTKRLFVVEQHTGRVRIIDLPTKTVKPTPFLEISDLARGNEQGLLGLAFHPKFAENGHCFVNLTIPGGTTHIRRYTVSNNPDKADPASALMVLSVRQPFSNHNGGWMGFGPKDGLLYIALGDGGSGNDPRNRAQNLGELLGKLLRLDVDRDAFPADPERHYAVPANNPFVNRPGALPEIWAYGLRNPWRNSFDRQTGDLYIADVGQSALEEISFQPANSPGGENYGWRVKEGSQPTGLDPLGSGPYVDPIHEYNHDEGQLAIIGGYVYRGAALPALHGTYFFADYTGLVWSFRFDPTSRRVRELRRLDTELFPEGAPLGITSFGEDAAGELYICDQDGAIHQLVGVPTPTAVAAPPRSASGDRSGRGREPSALAAEAVETRPTVASHRGVTLEFVPMPHTAAPGRSFLMAAPDAETQPPLMIKRPIDFAPRDWAVFLLQSAAEVEHALLVEYLYAAYSLKRNAVGPGGDSPETWQFNIIKVATEEMGHLLTVQNLLRLIGGPLSLDREDFPLRTAFYPFPFTLEPLSKDSLAKYVFAEMMAGDIDPAILPKEEREEIESRARKAVGNGSGSFINHVGTLYATLAQVVQTELKEEDFRTDRDDWQAIGGSTGGWSRTNANSSNLTGVKVLPTRNREEALTAISVIAQQGEASNLAGAHFNRFLQIYRQFPDDASTVTWPVRTNPTVNVDAVGATMISNPTTRLWAQLFNLRYRILLTSILHSVTVPSSAVWPQAPGAPNVRRMLIRWIYDEMLNGAGSLRELAEKLVEAPAADDADETAGPPFDLPYAVQIHDLGPERWRLHLDLLAASGQVVGQLSTEIPDDPTLAALIDRDNQRRTEIQAFLSSPH